MSDLRLALVQRAASLDPAQNREAVRRLADAVEPDTGLVLLPEAFQRDFGKAGSSLAEFGEPLDGPFVAALTELAESTGGAVAAGMFEVGEDPTRPYSTVVVVDRDGLRTSYRKMHLYDSFGHRESDVLSAGPVHPVLVDVAGVSVGLMNCYDLRFPELARELVRRGAQLLVVPAAWVAGPGKVDHWRTLVKARAIENTVYVAAVGQPGPRYTGHSMIAGPAGELVGELADGDHLLTASIKIDRLEQARADNPSLLNRRF